MARGGVSPLSWPADNRWPRLDYDFAVELGPGSKFLFRPIHRFGGFARHRDHFEDVCCYGSQPDIQLADRLCEAKDGALCRMVRLVKMPFDLINPVPQRLKVRAQYFQFFAAGLSVRRFPAAGLPVLRLSADRLPVPPAARVAVPRLPNHKTLPRNWNLGAVDRHSRKTGRSARTRFTRISRRAARSIDQKTAAVSAGMLRP